MKTDPLVLDDLRAWMRRFIYDAIEYGLYVPGGCLFLSALAAQRLESEGKYNAVFQAGSGLFRRRPAGPDRFEGDDEFFGCQFGFVEDASSPTGVSYDPAPALDALATGQMIEVHCWVGLPDVGIILDPVAPLIPEHAKLNYDPKRIPFVMPRPKPVRTMQELQTENPPSAIYQPDAVATLAMPLFMEHWTATKDDLLESLDPAVRIMLYTHARWLKTKLGWPQEAALKHLAKGCGGRDAVLEVKLQEVEADRKAMQAALDLEQRG
jgi:hypothetical protein